MKFWQSATLISSANASSILDRLKQQKKTVIFVSHDMGAVSEYCDKVILIDESKIVSSGNAADITKEYFKLFVPSSEDGFKTKDKKWGLGGVDIISVYPEKKVFTPEDSSIKIKTIMKALKEFDSEIIPGITIKNETGQMICGTNSRILKVQTGVPAYGEEIQIEWEVPNIFNEGIYIIEPAVAQASNMEICQWWDNAQTFRVINPEKTPYPVAPRIKLSLNRTAQR